MKSRLPSLILIFAAGCLSGLAAVGFFYFSASQNEATKTQTKPAGRSTATTVYTAATPAVTRIASPDSALVGASLQTFEDRLATALAFDSDRRRNWEIELLFVDMQPSEAAEFFARIYDNPDHRKNKALTESFFERWGAIDGANAFAAANTLEEKESMSALKSVFNTWAQSDLLAAWDSAQGFLNDPRRGAANIARGVLKEMAINAPDTLMDFIAGDMKNRLTGDHRNHIIEAAFEAGNQAQLLGKLSTIENEYERDLWTQKIYDRWAKADGDAPLAALAKIEDPADAEAALSGYLAGWSRSDPAAAVEYVLANKGNPAVDKTLNFTVFQAIQAGSAEQNGELVARLSALSEAEESQKGDSTQNSLTNQNQSLEARAMNAWASKDYDAARAYFDQLPTTEEKAKHLQALSTNLWRQTNSAAQLTSLFLSTPASPERTQALEQVINQSVFFAPNLSPEFKDALKQTAESETHLSENAKAALRKLNAE